MVKKPTHKLKRAMTAGDKYFENVFNNKMQEIKVQHITTSLGAAQVNKASILLDALDKYELGFVPWKSYPYKPAVSFAIAYTPTHILLKYFVAEKDPKATYTAPNSNVWEDSCVEFFISFNEEEEYYNLEFNRLGAVLMAYGKSKNERKLLNDKVINEIKTLSAIKVKNKTDTHWEFTILIPFSVFLFNDISNLNNQRCRANFYKCGDNTSEPHFLSWANIKAPAPNFHLSQYFGRLSFL